MTRALFFLSSAIFCYLIIPQATFAMTPEQQQEFNEILKMEMEPLHKKALKLLNKKYPSEDWDSHNFPFFVFASPEIETSYKIAVKEPQILITNFCYCFCNAMGHESLLSCFFKGGVSGGEFDEHASNCNICVSQALIALLWTDLEATEKEINSGMFQKYGK